MRVPFVQRVDGFLSSALRKLDSPSELWKAIFILDRVFWALSASAVLPISLRISTPRGVGLRTIMSAALSFSSWRIALFIM